MQAPLKAKLIIYPIAALSVYLAFLSFNIGLGSLISVRPEQAIAAWESDSRVFNIEEARRYQARLELAMALSPHNAFHKLWLGRLYLLLSDVEDKKANLEAAENFFILFNQQVPTWYEGWAFLSVVKFKMGGTEVNEPLSNALKLGMFEETNQRIVLRHVLTNWESLTDENRKLSAVTISHVFDYSEYWKELIFEAKKDNTLTILKEHVHHDWQLEKIRLLEQNILIESVNNDV